MKDKIICPKCRKEFLILSFQPQYHNEYTNIQYICNNCDFKSEILTGIYKLSEAKTILVSSIILHKNMF